MDVYITKPEGVGGVIKQLIDDFIVEEILVDNTIASVNGVVPTRVLGSSVQKQRFMLCLMVKRNWDTFIATKNVAKSLGIDSTRVQFAGIKDAKAVTAQHITIENVSLEEAAKVDVTDVKVIPVGYVREMMSLFYLLGNRFTITVRNVESNKEWVGKQIEQTIQHIAKVGGMPNFFGHQRFGTTRPITHLVGKALAQGNFEEAAMLFLAKPSPQEHPASKQARQILQDTHNFKQASETFPRQLRFERLMLHHLAENPEDYTGAFHRLPPKLQALFVQAHQSYLFNRFLSTRLKQELPLNVALVGDFVVAVERTGLPLTPVAKVVTTQTVEEINRQVALGKLRVALPIVGVKQKLSTGVMGEIEAEVLSAEGVSDKRRGLNELSRVGGKGGLRTTVAPVRDFKIDAVGGNSVQVSFMLLRGCYATVLLRELIKPTDPVEAGF